MKTITNEIIDKFIEAGLINIKSIDHVRKLEVMRDEFNLLEREQKIMDYEMGYINGGNQKKITGEKYYNETYGGNK